MATTTARQVIVHECCGVAPPPPAAAEERLPLTYFDMIWLYFHPVQRLLFYQHPCSKLHFIQHIVPNLRKSLSETLRHYRPLAGKLILPMNPDMMPELRYSPGNSVSVIFAEAKGDFDFGYLTGNHARDSDEFHPFIPDLPEPITEPESGVTAIPVLAVQVTLIPESGICICINNHHAAGDGSSMMGFIKSWSSVAKFGEDEILLVEKNSLPFYDRSVIKDPSNRAKIFRSHQMQTSQFGSTPSNLPTNDRSRATFILQKHEIQSLKNSVLEKIPGLNHLSSFVVATSYVWSCLAKASAESGEEVDDEEPEYFGYSVDARRRMEPPLPASYFGNCVALALVETTHGVLKGEDGFFAAAELVAEQISKKLSGEEELLRDADDWLVKFGPMFGKRLMGVSGSPQFNVYGADFGWGSPNKFEYGSLGRSIAPCKSREFEGGLEIGLSLPRKKLEAFAALFYNGLTTMVQKCL